MLRVLETSNFWLADGTFKVTPKMFYQFYSIHVSLSGVAPACNYLFLPKRTEKTYHRFLEALKILAPNIRPEKKLSDFEQAAIQAFQKNFPESKQEKTSVAQRKSAKFHACLRRKTDLCFSRAMANLSKIFYFLILCIYF